MSASANADYLTRPVDLADDRDVGLCVVHTHYDTDGIGICVMQADPLVYVHDDIPRHGDSGWPHTLYGEGILVIQGRNATVRYKLVERHPSQEWWLARRIDPGPRMPSQSCGYQADGPFSDTEK